MGHSSCFFIFVFFFVSFLSEGLIFVRFSPGKEGEGTHTIANPPCASLHPQHYSRAVTSSFKSVTFGTFSSPSTVYHGTRAANHPRNPVVNTQKIFSFFFCVYYVLSTRSTCPPHSRRPLWTKVMILYLTQNNVVDNLNLKVSFNI